MMTTGTIILIPFPFSELTEVKVRPAVVISVTRDKYKDVVLAAISSQVPVVVNETEMLVQPNKQNGLRVSSVIKVDRIFTLKGERIIAELGRLNDLELEQFKKIFKSLVD